MAEDFFADCLKIRFASSFIDTMEMGWDGMGWGCDWDNGDGMVWGWYGMVWVWYGVVPDGGLALVGWEIRVYKPRRNSSCKHPSEEGSECKSRLIQDALV